MTKESLWMLFWHTGNTVFYTMYKINEERTGRLDPPERRGQRRGC